MGAEQNLNSLHNLTGRYDSMAVDSASDIENLLNNDDSVSTDESEEVIKDEEGIKEEDPESIELDKEDKEEDEEKLELKDDGEEEKTEDLLVPHRWGEIAKKYPNLEKEFPYIKHAYQLSKQYTDIFPTVDDANEAIEKSEILESFEKDVASGDISRVIAAAREAGQEAVNQLADNYLEMLGKVDERAHLHVVSGVIKKAIIGMHTAGKEAEDETLLDAAATLNKFMFGTTKFEPHQRLTNGKNSEVEKVNKERQDWEREKYDSASSDLNERVDKAVRMTLDANIDPKNSMPPYVKRNAIRDAQEKLKEVLKNDKGFLKTIESQMKLAARERFSRGAMDKVKAIHLSKAKALLPSIIKQVRNDALKGLGKRQEKDRSGHLPVRSNISNERSGNAKNDKSAKRMPGETMSDALDRILG